MLTVTKLHEQIAHVNLQFSTFHNSPVAAFADRLRTARLAKRREDGKPWTQTDLAKAIGTSRNTVDSWENRSVQPRGSALSDLVKALGVRLEWLTEGKGPMGDVTAERLTDRADIERPLPRVARSHDVRVWQKEFELELVKAGATEEQVAEAMDLVRAPQVFTFFAGGSPKEFTDAQAIEGMEAIAHLVRTQYARTHGLKFPDKPLG